MPNPIFGNYHGYKCLSPSSCQLISSYAGTTPNGPPFETLVSPSYHPHFSSAKPSSTSAATKAGSHAKSVPATSPLYADPLIQPHPAHAWGAHRVVGVDIDDTLVRAAWKRRRTLWSLQPPPPHHVDGSPSPKRVHLDANADAEPEQHDLVADYFPISCPHSHGPLPIPAPTSNDHRDVFPHNVTFQTTDWVTEDTTRDEPIYDVVIAYVPVVHVASPPPMHWLTDTPSIQIFHHEMGSSPSRRSRTDYVVPARPPRVETGRRIDRRTPGLGDVWQGAPHGPSAERKRETPPVAPA
ncbi:hypothetical protein JVT61DRAFT_10217 [Boletus reticuloceps]|uniref:Uncharacterized protein n=1 Tax=Boletus reticuloceps TaxID=495285 RepID=A0A8I2YZ52_9AGAM|nr:hypothetical protein JVT61DRAFT_10217 [Boletus reticuloceps]